MIASRSSLVMVTYAGIPLPETYAATGITGQTCSTVTVESYHFAMASA
jgi:hypothetical protein